MKILVAVLIAVNVTSCAAKPTGEAVYIERYRTWRASLETELDAGYSKVFGDKEALGYLAANAQDHTEFLRHELESDMFCVRVLDASPLRTRLTTSSNSLQERQRVWLKILE